MSSSEPIWLVLKVAIREKLAGWEMQHADKFLASVPPERNVTMGQSSSSLCPEPN